MVVDHRPKLRLVKNSEPESRPEWLNFPELVRGRNPFSKNEIAKFRVSQADLNKQAEIARRQPIYEFWANVMGKPPPVSGQIEHPVEPLKSFWDAYACWQGINRPCGQDSDGHNLVAYCIKPKMTYGFEARPPATLAKLVAVPEDLVFVVFAKLDEPPGQPVSGVLTHWQFMETEVNNYLMPLGHENRFAKRLW